MSADEVDVVVWRRPPPPAPPGWLDVLADLHAAGGFDLDRVREVFPLADVDVPGAPAFTSFSAQVIAAVDVLLAGAEDGGRFAGWLRGMRRRAVREVLVPRGPTEETPCDPAASRGKINE